MKNNDFENGFGCGMGVGMIIVIVILFILSLILPKPPTINDLVEKNVLEYRMTNTKIGKTELFWKATGEKFQ